MQLSIYILYKYISLLGQMFRVVQMLCVMQRGSVRLIDSEPSLPFCLLASINLSPTTGSSETKPANHNSRISEARIRIVLELYLQNLFLFLATAKLTVLKCIYWQRIFVSIFGEHTKKQNIHVFQEKFGRRTMKKRRGCFDRCRLNKEKQC